MAIFILFDGLGPELFENINKLSPIQQLAQLNSVLFLLKMQNKRKAFDKMRRRPLKMLKQKNVSWEAISVEKNKGWDLQSSKSPNSMKIVLFADFVSSNPGLSQAQYVLKQLCNEGHQITLFECANVSVPLLMYEDTQACLCQIYEEPLKVLEKKVAEADAFLLVTDKPGLQIPPSLATVKHHFKGSKCTWRPYGVQCVLLGGSVHSRRVAMRLRVLLEGSDYPYMSGVLPRRCSWTEMYAVDPSLETPGPCVL